MLLSFFWFFIALLFALLWLSATKTPIAHDIQKVEEEKAIVKEKEVENVPELPSPKWWNSYQPAISWSNLNDLTTILNQHHFVYHIAEDTWTYWNQHRTLPIKETPLTLYLFQIDHDRYIHLKRQIIQHGFTPITDYHWVRRTGNEIIFKFRSEIYFTLPLTTTLYGEKASFYIPSSLDNISDQINLSLIESFTCEEKYDDVSLQRGLLKIEENRWKKEGSYWGPIIDTEDIEDQIIGFSFQSFSIHLLVQRGSTLHCYILPGYKTTLEAFWNGI